MAIKVLIKRKFPKNKDQEKKLFQYIKEIRRRVPQQPGYISGEYLKSIDDKDVNLYPRRFKDALSSKGILSN